MVRLSDVKEKDTVIVADIDAKSSEKTQLEAMGFIPGSLVSLIAKLPFKGPIALTLRGTKFALSRDLCKHILVTPT